MLFATRPLLLSILRERLEKPDHGGDDWHNFLGPTKSLILTGIKSASKTLQLLSDEDSILGTWITPRTKRERGANHFLPTEAFLPFDLEHTFGAAIYLTMTDTLFPDSLGPEGQNHSQTAHVILDEIILRGNRLANERKAELKHLESLFQELRRRMELNGFQTLASYHNPEPGQVDENMQTQGNDANATGGDGSNTDRVEGLSPPRRPSSSYSAAAAAAENTNIEDAVTADEIHPETTALPMFLVGHGNGNGHDAQPSSSTFPSPPTSGAGGSNLEFLDIIGISSHEFLSIVDQIGHHDSGTALDLSGPEHREDEA